MTRNYTKHICTYKEGTWSDFREDVKKINNGLFEIIEQINPSKKYTLIKVQYPYGEAILEEGIPCLPDIKGHFSRIDSANIPASIKEKLSYCATPLALQLVNSGEVFLEIGERIVPLYLFVPGSMFGLFEAATHLCERPVSPIWNVTAGARSVVMTPKITDAIAHNRIRKELGIKNPPPKNLADHWNIFKSIVKHSDVENPWLCEILFFTKDWLKDHKEDIGWIKFHEYLLKESWIQSSHMRTRTELSMMWETFATAVGHRHLKPNSYIVDTVKNLMYLALGQNPGFKVADDNELALPTKLIEEVYKNIYLLKEYAPTILHTYRLDIREKNLPVYYSLAYPTLLEGTPSIRHAASIMSELREVKMLMDMLLKVLEKYSGGQYAIIKNTLFKYFHNEQDRFGEMSVTDDILLNNSTITNALAKKFPGKIFAKNGQFFKGCIEIMHK